MKKHRLSTGLLGDDTGSPLVAELNVKHNGDFFTGNLVHQEGKGPGVGFGLRAAARESCVVGKAVFHRKVAHGESVAQYNGLAFGQLNQFAESEVEAVQLIRVGSKPSQIACLPVGVKQGQAVGDCAGNEFCI